MFISKYDINRSICLQISKFFVWWNFGLSNYDVCYVIEGKNFYWELIWYCYLFYRYKEKIQDS